LNVSPAATADGPGFFLDRPALRALGTASRERYATARPYPHAVFDGFLGDALAEALAARFPRPDHPGWKRRDYAEQSRLSQLQRTGFDGVAPSIRHLLAELQGMAFLDFLGALTGIEGLIGDPHYGGGGPQLTLPGGHLALHADFNLSTTCPKRGTSRGAAPSSCGRPTAPAARQATRPGSTVSSSWNTATKPGTATPPPSPAPRATSGP
jgi:hypothetical protein